MELAFKTITSVDILVWVVGISALRALTATPLARGNDKQGAGVNSCDNRGKDWMGDGGHQATRDGGGCVVYRPGNDTICRGRFSRRAKSLEHQRRKQAHANSAKYLSPGRAALRASWYQALEQATAELETGDFTTGAATGLASHAGTLKEEFIADEAATQAGKKSAAPREGSSQDRKDTTKHHTVKGSVANGPTKCKQY